MGDLFSNSLPKDTFGILKRKIQNEDLFSENHWITQNDCRMSFLMHNNGFFQTFKLWDFYFLQFKWNCHLSLKN